MTAFPGLRRAKATIVVLWSDHGYHLGEKLIAGKNTLWEAGTRVPFIWAGPGITAGARSPRPVELLDIYPTLLELCGLAPATPLQGHSLVPLLRDADAPRPWPAITTYNRGSHSVRDARWRTPVTVIGPDSFRQSAFSDSIFR